MIRTLLVLVLLAGSAVADDTQTYVVQKGDSCISIAIRVLGDRAAVNDIHRLNPQLGRPPHHLVPGSQLTLPAAKPQGPDARLTRAFGDVKIRKPSSEDWGIAQRGADLFRAYRVGAASQSSAEVKFADDGLLGMRERTIVVIYGPEKRLAKVITATAELESGSLESRLGELDGKPVIVHTVAGDADLRAGEVVVTANDDGRSVLSNHGGNTVELRGHTKKRSAVKVAAGMGTRVSPGAPPEPPRPLPPAPVWIGSGGPRIATARGTVVLAWQASEHAARYRVAVRSPDGDLIAATIAEAPTAELPLAPGRYDITVAAFDADGLESIPSPVLSVERIVPTFVPPNGRTPDPGAATPHTVALGTTILAPDGITCSAGGSYTAVVILDHTGSTSIVCSDSAEHVSEPLSVDVIDLAPRSVAAPSIAAPAPVGPARVRDRLEVGMYFGYHTVAVRRPVDLEAAPDRMHALEDGPTIGMRGGMFRRMWGLEAEVGVSSFDRLGAVGTAQAIDAGVHGVLRHDESRVSLRLLAGARVTTLVNDGEGDVGATTIGFSWGGAAALSLSQLQLRADLRHELAPGYGGGVGQALSATLGVSMSLR